jgi:exonuclease VII large subunit
MKITAIQKVLLLVCCVSIVATVPVERAGAQENQDLQQQFQQLEQKLMEKLEGRLEELEQSRRNTDQQLESWVEKLNTEMKQWTRQVSRRIENLTGTQGEDWQKAIEANSRNLEQWITETEARLGKAVQRLEEQVDVAIRKQSKSMLEASEARLNSLKELLEQPGSGQVPSVERPQAEGSIRAALSPTHPRSDSKNIAPVKPQLIVAEKQQASKEVIAEPAPATEPPVKARPAIAYDREDQALLQAQMRIKNALQEEQERHKKTMRMLESQLEKLSKERGDAKSRDAKSRDARPEDVSLPPAPVEQVPQKKVRPALEGEPDSKPARLISEVKPQPAEVDQLRKEIKILREELNQLRKQK